MFARVVRWLSRVPLPLLHLWGGWLGWLTYALAPTYRRRFAAHAAQAGLPRERWRPAIAEAGRMLAELPWLWLRPVDEPISPRVSWVGAEVVDAALERARAQERGIVFLTPHLGAFEVTAQAYAERWGRDSPVTVLYRPSRQPWLRELVDTARTRPGLATAPASLAGVRQMMRALRRGEAVGLLPDQVPPDGMGVWAPFFGRPAYTMTLAARLAQQTGAEIVLMRCERAPRGAGYVMHVEPLGEVLPDGDAADPAHQAACAAVVNRAMERLVLQCPEQYLWGYHRYKAPRRGSPTPTDAI
jgi:KDO2-lipid IV(A) lauroyltransferase